MSPISAKRPRLATPPPPTSWFDLPFEMREMVIDQMDPKTRCKFAECSKLCEIEAKASKNYMKKIGIKWFSNPKLYIGHDKKCYNYCLEFVEALNYKTCDHETTVIYKTFSKVSDVNKRNKKILVFHEKWTKIEPGNAEEVRLRYLTGFIDKHEKGITELEVNDEEFSDKTVLKRLKNLEFIKESLFNLLKKDFVDLTQVLNVNHASLSYTALTFDQIVQFKGSKLTVTALGFNEKTILKYLKMWKNGEINKNVKILNIDFRNRKSIDGIKIIKGLDVSDYESSVFGSHFKFRLNYPTAENCYTSVFYDNDSLSVKIEKEQTFEESSENSDESTSENESSSDDESTSDDESSSDDENKWNEESLTTDSDSDV